MITADALHCQREHVAYLAEHGAHWILTAKGNQPRLHDQLTGLPWQAVPDATRDTDRGHGRREIRSLKTLTISTGTTAARTDRHADQILIITAAYTGMRWGELAGLARTNTHPGDALIRIHPETDALHKVQGRLYLGPPKTTGSARDIHLPPFLTDLLQEILDSHDHDQVFCGARAGFLQRSNMSRRVFGPAVNGDPRHHTGPIITGMHSHDLRHTHKTWLTEDDIPEVAQAQRLGHRIPGVRGIYSHVTPDMHHRITTALQARWQATQPNPTATTPTRHLRAA